jgi:hypothetical protein
MKKVLIKINKKHTDTELIYTYPDNKPDQEIKEELNIYFERIKLYLP